MLELANAQNAVKEETTKINLKRLGLAYYKLSMYEEAIPHYQQANWDIMLASCYTRLGKINDAYKCGYIASALYDHLLMREKTGKAFDPEVATKILLGLLRECNKDHEHKTPIHPRNINILENWEVRLKYMCNHNRNDYLMFYSPRGGSPSQR